MDKLEIINTRKQLVINDVCMDGSTFTNVSGKALVWDDVNLTGTKIKNANLSNLEIKGAQLGGAYFQHIGLPSEGHAHHDPDKKQRPLRFDSCDLNHTTITSCDLSGVEMNNCNVDGMKINGVDVTEMIKAFESQQNRTGYK